MAKKPRFERPFPERFWDRPTPRTQGDDNENVVFTAVGRALSKWEDVEETLAMLVSLFSESAHDPKMNTLLRQLFGTIESSANRRTAIENVADLYFHPHENDDNFTRPLGFMLEDVSKASRRRDDIAHGKVTHFHSPQEDLRRGAFLFPSEYNTGRNSPYMTTREPFPLSAKRGKFRYVSSDINMFTAKFELLRQYIMYYASAIHKVDGLVRPVPMGLIQKIQAIGQKRAPNQLPAESGA